MLSRFAKSFVAIIIVMLLLAMLGFFHAPMTSYMDPLSGEIFGDGGVEGSLHQDTANAKPNDVAEGGVIMSKLGNATAKAELGRATWKLLHTMTLRYPENPNADEREALNSYFHLFSRLYPCGECATEFQQLLRKFPPQTSSRRSASLWLCAVHNQVNKRLEKPEFDCAHLDETYDCGCGDEPVSTSAGVVKEAGAAKEAGNDPMDLEHDPTKDEVTGAEMIRGGRR
ncbi:ERV/ALR sulfhydryl oxidase domain-containing protein [Schizophyllum amplum]|uniref:Sulfhydryl oxidase n=1 Tax=Schizophyllum amplum TaxID=97359 RepID=A0A550CVM4_9AGAR|nr:ERV/ALR sulfhydryl oxidase domain-containing protein [Auriculariopsis ampla]